MAVAHAGELLGVLRLQERPGLPLSSVEERLFTALASRAGLMLRLAGVRAELQRQHRDLERREDDLTASRERLRNGAALTIGVDHPEYRFSQKVPAQTAAALARDLA